MSDQTEADIHCVLKELDDPSILPSGWCMIRREGEAGEGLFGIKYLGGSDPLAELEAVKAREEADERDTSLRRAEILARKLYRIVSHPDNDAVGKISIHFHVPEGIGVVLVLAPDAGNAEIVGAIEAIYDRQDRLAASGTASEPPANTDAVLREAGYDPEEVAARSRETAMKATYDEGYRAGVMAERTRITDGINALRGASEPPAERPVGEEGT